MRRGSGVEDACRRDHPSPPSHAPTSALLYVVRPRDAIPSLSLSTSLPPFSIVFDRGNAHLMDLMKKRAQILQR